MLTKRRLNNAVSDLFILFAKLFFFSQTLFVFNLRLFLVENHIVIMCVETVLS